jgi:uncharacterized protein YjbK
MAIERELKFMLTREGYDTLRTWAQGAGRVSKEAEQTNIYFDTADARLADQHLCLRLRNKRGTWELTLKARFEFEAIEQVCEEINAPLSETDATRFQRDPAQLLASQLPPMARLRELAQVPSLTRLGELVTKRAVIGLDGGHTAELDHSRYLGHEDFELECETEDAKAADAAITALFASLDVDTVRSEGPKLARFMARYR